MAGIHLQMYKRIMLKALNSPHLLPDLACCLNCMAGGGEEVGLSGSASNPSSAVKEMNGQSCTASKGPTCMLSFQV